jgi:hypothetical protein
MTDRQEQRKLIKSCTPIYPKFFTNNSVGRFRGSDNWFTGGSHSPKKGEGDKRGRMKGGVAASPLVMEGVRSF